MYLCDFAMIFSWKNCFPDMFRIFQCRRVRSRAQMATFGCVVDRFAPYSPPDIHDGTCPGHEKILHFHGLYENTGFGVYLCGGGVLAAGLRISAHATANFSHATANFSQRRAN